MDVSCEKTVQNEGSSGYVDEKKQKQVSGIRCQVSGGSVPWTICRGLATWCKKTVQNEGSSGYVDENK
jgi:hypothetical protein